MDRRSLTHLGIILVTALAAGPAEADTVIVRPSRDGTLYEEDGALANGSGEHFFAGRSMRGPLRRGIVAFDLRASIPAGSTISSVALELELTRTRVGDTEITLHRVLEAWSEGTTRAAGSEGRGETATGGDVTWSHASYDAVPWSTPGGALETSASASMTVGLIPGLYRWQSAAMTADVQRWLDDPSTNHGWILIGDEASGRDAKRFASRQNTNFAARPRLVVTFTSAVPAGACCDADGSCGVVPDPGPACSGLYEGLGTVCDPNPCPQPPGGCCIPDGAATCTEILQTECEAMSGTFFGPNTDCTGRVCPLVLTPFVDPLPSPRVAVPTQRMPDGTVAYTMHIREAFVRVHRDLAETRMWLYDDGAGPIFPGPTFEATRGVPVEVEWANDLRDETGALRTQHLLPVDDCVHGAAVDDARTVVHLHGGHVPAEFDGHPELTQLPGESVVYRYPNDQSAALLWYHDHALGITRLNAYLGLAGAYVIRDPEEEAGLGLPSGDYEIPLVIADRSFRADGSLVYPAAWREMFFGDVTLVNGKVWPFLEVDRATYRFRVLNASNGRTYTLTLPDGSPFWVIGNDGGLLEAPVNVMELTLMPAERADILIDFSGYAAGTEIILTNRAPAPFPGVPGEGVLPDVMKFVVTDATGPSVTPPSTLRAIEGLDEADAVVTRDLRLERLRDMCTGPVWMINGRGFDDIDERPMLGDTEIWRFINPSGMAHPMHIHLDFFQVLDRQPFVLVDDEIVTTGPPEPPGPEDLGWKDTARVGPNEILRVITRFSDYTGLYVYHCHILEHEDHVMMRQFETQTACGDGVLGQPAEECDDGDANSDTTPDACRSDCRRATCGDGIVDTGETCDPPETCATDCDDGDPCTSDVIDGSPESCDVRCVNDPIECAPVGEIGGGGCGCRATSDGHEGFPFAGCLGIVLLLTRRRRR